MKCKNCGATIMSFNGPKPYISVRSDGGIGTLICSRGTKLFTEGHKPEGNSNATI